MDDQITLVYCLCDDLLKATPHHDEPARSMSDAEVMTTAIVAALHFSGNFERARLLLSGAGYIPRMLSKSQFNRRLHRLVEAFSWLFFALAQVWKHLNPAALYVIDTYPVAALDNIRIRRARLYHGEAYRGYSATKRRFWYGLKVHLLVSADGRPVECVLTPGSVADVKGWSLLPLDLPAGSVVIGDAPLINGGAYNDAVIEDAARYGDGVELLPVRRRNMKAQHEAAVRFLQHYYRQAVETAGSLIERLLPKTIHAVTPAGFELKVFLFVLAYSVSGLL